MRAEFKAQVPESILRRLQAIQKPEPRLHSLNMV